MKIKIIIPVLLLLFLIFILMFPKSNLKEDKVIKTSNEYSFYISENESRYQSYKLKYPLLSMRDVIIRVNLGLDFPFYTNTKASTNLNTNMVLVNKYNYLEEDYVPNNLEKLEVCTSKEIYLVKEAKLSFEKMCSDAKNEGIIIRAISGYRSYMYQKNLYDNYVLKDGRDKADTYSARAGFSEHQTGLAFDIDNEKDNYENFENTKEFIWMMENAHKYGFILRYPKDKENITGYNYESWHFRYVGSEIAKKIHQSNITFDEYYISNN